ncbi:MAG: TetR/AcrR family transcriptional regulator [Myxococcota bacterium]
MSTATTPSPKQRRRAEDLARRREDAVAAAAAVFAEKGFHAAQMTEIAARAELSRATLYALFEGKDELYTEVIATAARGVRDLVRGQVEGTSDPAERLLGVIDALFACFEASQDLLRIYARGTHGIPFRIRQELGDEPFHVFQEFADWVTGLAEAADRAGRLGGLDPRAVATTLVGSVTLTATRWIETTPELPLSRATQTVRPIFERLLTGAPGS